MTSKVKLIDAILPQTQCGECGFKGCLPYAEALVNGVTTIDKCPPGGVETLIRLAKMLYIEPTPYLKTMQKKTRPPAKAIIKESECIGCTKCIQSCPVDAIIGSAKQMHSIVADDCTGCGLCVEPCPVDCIEMLPIADFTYDPNKARARYQNKQARQIREQSERKNTYRDKTQLSQKNNLTDEIKARQDYILAALDRVKAKNNE